MMLRGSIEQRGEAVELKTIIAGAEVDSGVEGSAVLVGLVEAALDSPAELPEARAAVIAALGDAALVDAAGVIGNFQRMVRIADATGIPVDADTAAVTADIREELGLNAFASARMET
jgi:hypothetical protein